MREQQIAPIPNVLRSPKRHDAVESRRLRLFDFERDLVRIFVTYLADPQARTVRERISDFYERTARLVASVANADAHHEITVTPDIREDVDRVIERPSKPLRPFAQMCS